MYRSMTVEEGAGAPTVVNFLGTFPWKRAVSSLTICGHSLGGAIATLVALDVAANTAAPFNNPTVYTYASPRTGDHDFAVKYHQTVTTTYRFVDTVDLVPKLPGIFPYRHVTDAINLDSLTLDSAEGAAPAESVVLAHFVELFVLDLVIFGRRSAESRGRMRASRHD